MIKKAASGIYSVLIFLFLYAPIAVLIVFSFNNTRSKARWEGFTLKWYVSMFKDSNIMEALFYTITIAFLAAVIATVIGTVAAIGIHAMKPLYRSAVMNISYLPVLNPDIVTGISLMLLFAFIGLRLGYFSMLIAHVSFNIPYVILSVMPKLKQMNKNTYEAAQDLGASPVQAIFKAVIPEISPGIVTGFILAFTLSIDDFVISFFTAGSGITNLSIYIYSMTRRGIKPEINALSAIMFVTVLILLLIVNRRSSRAVKKPRQPSAAPAPLQSAEKID